MTPSLETRCIGRSNTPEAKAIRATRRAQVNDALRSVAASPERDRRRPDAERSPALAPAAPHNCMDWFGGREGWW